jgi:hypothetical protein
LRCAVFGGRLSVHKWPIAAYRRTPPEQDPIDAILDLAIDEDLAGC